MNKLLCLLILIKFSEVYPLVKSLRVRNSEGLLALYLFPVCEPDLTVPSESAEKDVCSEMEATRSTQQDSAMAVDEDSVPLSPDDESCSLTGELSTLLTR